MTGVKRWLLLLAVLIGVIAVWRVGRVLTGSGEVSELRDSLAVLRAAADSCRNSLEQGEASLQAYHSRLDTLRERVREFEALDPRGVPADSYRIYMRAFATYNDSAGAWQTRVDTLQASLARCRTVTEAHNVKADSLRRLLQQTPR